jgi:hypothetical protein
MDLCDGLTERLPRERQRMPQQAATASTDTERAAWLALAESWLRLARKTEVQETASSMSVAREVRRQTHRKNLMLWLITTGQGHGFLTALINFGEIAV